MAIAISAISQMPEPQLKQGDVEKFIKTISPLSKEIRENGVDTLFPDMLPYLDEMENLVPIFEKYGWEQGFGRKWSYIICCQAIASNYVTAGKEVGSDPIKCDDILLNPADVKLVLPKQEALLEAIVAGFTGG